MEKKKYNIQYSTSFNKELVEIIDYLNHILNNSNAAARLLDELEGKIKILMLFQKMFSPQTYNDVLMYKFNIQNYIIYYSIHNSTVKINHIFYSKRNLSNLLNSIK